ncbi:MAG: succinate dehydrogenase [Puniceicoccaceae bacterium]|nr:MAG: succinate dehydrogenase [Puniceicoccaceae bacterium]
MKLLTALFTTSIGKKVIMAVTGLILVGFVIGHLVGNLQIFAAPEVINSYAHFLQSLGPALWAVRLFLLAAVGLHIWAAIQLTLENRRARPRGYDINHTIQASYASRTMRWSGFIVLAFLLFHLAHFTARVGPYEKYNDMTATINHQGQVIEVLDVHSMMVIGFQQPLVSLFYIVAIGLLSLHLSHGIMSMFQSVGLVSNRWRAGLTKAAVVISVAYFIGNLLIPLSILLGWVDVQNPALLASS